MLSRASGPYWTQNKCCQLLSLLIWVTTWDSFPFLFLTCYWSITSYIKAQNYLHDLAPPPPHFSLSKVPSARSPLLQHIVPVHWGWGHTSVNWVTGTAATWLNFSNMEANVGKSFFPSNPSNSLLESLVLGMCQCRHLIVKTHLSSRTSCGSLVLTGNAATS